MLFLLASQPGSKGILLSQPESPNTAGLASMATFARRMENPSWFPQVPSKLSQKYTKIMENHPLSISFLRF